MEETLDEALLEELFWEFDHHSKKGGESVRDVFKNKMRYFAKYGRLKNDVEETI